MLAEPGNRVGNQAKSGHTVFDKWVADVVSGPFRAGLLQAVVVGASALAAVARNGLGQLALSRGSG